MFRKIVTSIAVAAACLGAGVADAHHSSAMFDRSKIVVLEGTVKEYRFVQPHSWISIMVPRAGGAPVRWDIEGGSAARMREAGFTRTSLKFGDRVKIRAFALRDGRHGGALLDVTFADGTVYTNNVTRLDVGR